MNTPLLETERLLLRKFTEDDMDALFLILSDEEANRFLPWFPARSRKDAERFFEERYASVYAQPEGYAYAICMKDDHPIGYINAALTEPHDFGYGLRREFWHKGIATEAGRAVIGRLRQDGLPYITATHDRNNPRSGGVMRNLGMRYRYSYREQWQPKDISVIFRMYQLNLDGDEDRLFTGYRDRSDGYFIEEDALQPS